MKKKLIALCCAAIMLLSTSVSAFAAPTVKRDAVPTTESVLADFQATVAEQTQDPTVMEFATMFYNMIAEQVAAALDEIVKENPLEYLAAEKEFDVELGSWEIIDEDSIRLSYTLPNTTLKEFNATIKEVNDNAPLEIRQHNHQNFFFWVQTSDQPAKEYRICQICGTWEETGHARIVRRTSK